MTYKYFSGLKYTLANEDTGFELTLVKKFKPKVIVSVAGSGSRSFPLLINNFSKLYCLDINESQLLLCELRLRTYLDLNYNEFIAFWGYSQCDNRKMLFEKLQISPRVLEMFLPIFKTNHWESILYYGSWEQTFRKFSKVAKFIIGDNRLKLFECKTLDEQRIYYKNNFSKIKWYLVLKILGNKAVFNTLLYKGSFVKKNINENYFNFYKKRFDHLFNHTLARENFFLQLCLLGEIKFNEANLVEANYENFHLVKQAITNNNCNFVLKSCIDFLENYHELEKIDFLSLSDVPSYFNDHLINNYLQKIKNSLNPNAIIVIRYYLKIPLNPNLSGFKDITSDFANEISQEKVGVYNIKVLQKIME